MRLRHLFSVLISLGALLACPSGPEPKPERPPPDRSARPDAAAVEAARAFLLRELNEHVEPSRVDKRAAMDEPCVMSVTTSEERRPRWVVDFRLLDDDRVLYDRGQFHEEREKIRPGRLQLRVEADPTQPAIAYFTGDRFASNRPYLTLYFSQKRIRTAGGEQKLLDAVKTLIRGCRKRP